MLILHGPRIRDQESLTVFTGENPSLRLLVPSPESIKSLGPSKFTLKVSMGIGV